MSEAKILEDFKQLKHNQKSESTLSSYEWQSNMAFIIEAFVFNLRMAI